MFKVSLLAVNETGRRGRGPVAGGGAGAAPACALPPGWFRAPTGLPRVGRQQQRALLSALLRSSPARNLATDMPLISLMSSVVKRKIKRYFWLFIMENLYTH